MGGSSSSSMKPGPIVEAPVASLPRTPSGPPLLTNSDPSGGISQAGEGKTPLLTSTSSGKGTVPLVVEEPGEGTHADAQRPNRRSYADVARSGGTETEFAHDEGQGL